MPAESDDPAPSVNHNQTSHLQIQQQMPVTIQIQDQRLAESPDRADPMPDHGSIKPGRSGVHKRRPQHRDRLNASPAHRLVEAAADCLHFGHLRHALFYDCPIFPAQDSRSRVSRGVYSGSVVQRQKQETAEHESPGFLAGRRAQTARVVRCLPQQRLLFDGAPAALPWYVLLELSDR